MQSAFLGASEGPVMAQPAGRTGRVGKEPLPLYHLCAWFSFSSDQPCPRPEDMLWGLSGAVQRCKDGGGLWGREALPADGLEQAHSGECP